MRFTVDSLEPSFAVSQEVSQFVLDDLDGFENLILVTSTGDHHLAGPEDKADDLGVIESVDEAGELLGFVFNLVKRQVEGQVVEVEFPWDAGLRLARELVNSVVVFGVVKGVGGDHVLNFNRDVFEVPGFNASRSQILDHAVDAGVDVVFVLPARANGSTGAEHQNGKFGLGNTVDHTGELLGFVLAVELVQKSLFLDVGD